MKILFSCIGIVSHFKPMLPFADALKARGHDVRFAAAEGLSEEIRQAGFQHLILDGVSEQTSDEFKKRFTSVPAKDAGKLYAAKVFTDLFPKAALPGLIEKLKTWRPDLIVREPTEFSALIAAQLLEVRHVRLEILNGESEESLALAQASIEQLTENLELLREQQHPLEQALSDARQQFQLNRDQYQALQIQIETQRSGCQNSQSQIERVHYQIESLQARKLSHTDTQLDDALIASLQEQFAQFKALLE